VCFVCSNFPTKKHYDWFSKTFGNICWICSPSIIKYLEPSTSDLFTVRFVDSHFDESDFPTLGGERKKLEKDIGWIELSLSHLDSRIEECELEVQRIIHLQKLTNQLPNGFTDRKR